MSPMLTRFGKRATANAVRATISIGVLVAVIVKVSPGVSLKGAPAGRRW
jgi:hypothetical protein